MRRTIAAVTLLIFASQPVRGDTVLFKDACGSHETLRVSAVGDIIFHKQLLAQIFNRKRAVETFWAPVQSVFDRADMTYGNLEGPVAPRVTASGRRLKHDRQAIDYQVYGYRLESLSFNFPPAVLDGLAASGFDVISTANNHALDRGSLGVDLTIDGLVRRKLPFTGTRKRGVRRGDRAVIVTRNGFRIAWLACTYSNNGRSDPHSQVTQCYKDTPEILAEVRRHDLDPTVDAVIVLPHWGGENHYRPSARQRKLARTLINAGALAVIGAHPHVVQPWERHVTPDGREGLIVYSTGNFLSNQRQLMQRAGVIVTLEFARSLQTLDVGPHEVRHRVTKLSGAGYVPTWVVIDGKGHRTIENAGRQASALKWTQRILPAGNRVAMAAPFAVPKTCGPTAVAATSSALAPGRLSLRSAPAVQSTAVKKTTRRTGTLVRAQLKKREWRKQILGSN